MLVATSVPVPSRSIVATVPVPDAVNPPSTPITPLAINTVPASNPVGNVTVNLPSAGHTAPVVKVTV